MAVWITYKQLADEMGVTPQTITAWKKAGKLKGLIRNGRVNKDKALETLPGRIAPKQQQSQNIRWGKEQKPPAQNPETEDEVKTYLDETIGDLARLDIYELQKRNELEKLLLQRIKRKKEEGELIERETVEADWTQHIIAAKTKILSIKSRTANILSDYIQDKTVLHSALSAVDECVREALTELAEGGESDE